MGTMRIIKTTGETFDEECPDEFEYQEPMVSRLEEIVKGDLEFVSVDYEGKPCYMIVNELGALIPLGVNPAASLIYWARTMRRKGLSFVQALSTLNPVYGDAVVLFDCKLK